MWSLLQTQEPLIHLPLNVQSLGQRSWAIVSTIGGIVGVVSLVVSFELTVMFSIITSLHSFINIETAPIAKERSPVNCKEKENATLLPSTTTVGEVNMQTYNTDLFENHAVNVIELYTIFLNWYRSIFFWNWENHSRTIRGYNFNVILNFRKFYVSFSYFLPITFSVVYIGNIQKSQCLIYELRSSKFTVTLS